MVPPAITPWAATSASASQATRARNPCSNGGLCRDGINNFVCTCLPGFRGGRCEQDINECESNPCKNGANCTDCVNSYTCSCPPGFSGINCEINTNDCTESSCFNGGTCVDGINAFTCLCLPGFTGSYCQHDINECDSKPCINGGTCLDSYGTYKCTCPHGYTGVNCQVCERDRQICINIVLYLLFCISEINECQSQPCQNGGTCIDLINTYKCSCPRGTQEVGWQIIPVWNSMRNDCLF
uniref:EGF-like domain-containing protein n=1 Tax=Myripristis murdjan TaxID=586833 RepID=A0A667WCJ3_9TELE